MLDFPRISAKTRATAVRPLDNRQVKAVPTHVDRWRRENPNAVQTWTTKHGYVVQVGSIRQYFGRCKDCRELIYQVRNVAHLKRGPSNCGRWRERCNRCSEIAAATAARAGMRRLRSKRKQPA